MRATCETAERRQIHELPHIRCSIDTNIKKAIYVCFSSSCRIFKTKDDITIKISDRGGGMSRRVRRKIFNYMYSTAPKVILLPTKNVLFEVRFLGGVAYFWRFIWRGFGGRSSSYAWAWIWSAPVEALCKVLLISM